MPEIALHWPGLLLPAMRGGRGSAPRMYFFGGTWDFRWPILFPPPAGASPSLDFSVAGNSMYIALLEDI